MKRSLSPHQFRKLSRLAAADDGQAVRHPADDSTLTSLPCGGFKVDYDPEVAEGCSTFRLLTPNFVLGLLDIKPQKPLQFDLSSIEDPNVTMIFIGVSTAAPTPWRETVTDTSSGPQTFVCDLSEIGNRRPTPRVGAHIRAVTMSTLGESGLGEFEPSLRLIGEFGTSANLNGVSLRIADTDKAIIRVARQMLANPFSGRVLEAYIRAKAVEILCLMLNGLERAPKNTESGLVREVRAAIDSILSEPLDVEALANATHLSARSLFRKFKAETGMTLGEYQRFKRLELAANLLVTTDLSITEIGGEVGFSETASFSRAFSQYHSISPSEFRRLGHE